MLAVMGASEQPWRDAGKYQPGFIVGVSDSRGPAAPQADIRWARTHSASRMGGAVDAARHSPPERTGLRL